jgi:hypothetical protein
VPREHCLDRDEPEDLSRRAALEDGYEWWISQPFQCPASVGRAAEKVSKGFDMSDIVALCLVAEGPDGHVRDHAAAKITRSLIGLTLIEGSCPEVGVFGPLDLQDGTGPVIASRSVG